MAGFLTRPTYPAGIAGMPIEIQIEKKFGKGLPQKEVQAKSRAYATEQIDKQRKDFMRLGVLGEWENPYLTMAPRNEADEIRALQDLRRGLRVPWPEAGELVFRLRLGAGRNRGRISRQDRPGCRRRFPFC